MKSWSKRCEVHPDFLEHLAEADGDDRPLPRAPEGCACCAANRDRFVTVQAALRGVEAAPDPILSADWQAEVWLRLGQESFPPGSLLGGAEGGNIVRFPLKPHPLEAEGPDAGEPEADEQAPGAGEAEPPDEDAGATPRRLFYAALGVILVAAGAAFAIGFSDVGQPDLASEVPAGSLIRGGHALQPANPPRVQAAPRVAGRGRTPLVELKAYAVDEEGEALFDSLQDGSTIRPGAQLSFDYATHLPEVEGDQQYLTVVAVTRSAAAQEEAVPEDKQLLWLVEAKPVQNTRGELSVLEEEDIRVDAPAGDLTIFGLVSNQPVSARAIEDALVLYNAAPSALPGVGVARLQLRVEEQADGGSGGGVP